MTHNDLLRRLRYALNLNAVSISETCALAGHNIKPTLVLQLLKKEDEKGFEACDNSTMTAFLDGLIISRRGIRNESLATPTVQTEMPLNNNLILRKLRIALELTDTDMLEILKRAGISLSKAELSALFRGVSQRNYKECGDQMLRNFVKGLTISPTKENI